MSKKLAKAAALAIPLALVLSACAGGADSADRQDKSRNRGQGNVAKHGSVSSHSAATVLVPPTFGA